MKSFKEYLSESWKKKRNRDREARANFSNPFLNNERPRHFNKREDRLGKAFNKRIDANLGSERDREFEDIDSKLTTIRKNQEPKEVYRGLKMTGGDPGPGFGEFLYKARRTEGSGIRNMYIDPLVHHFRQQANIRGKVGTAISDDKNDREREAYGNKMTRLNDPTTPAEHKEALAAHIKRNATRIRKLGLTP